eukprot:1150964-Pelagomonas_calceolata.AAC.5
MLLPVLSRIKCNMLLVSILKQTSVPSFVRSPNRLFTNVRTNEIRTTLTVPCQELPDICPPVTAESIDIQVTFSDGRDGAFQYANLRLPISSTCKCEALYWPWQNKLGQLHEGIMRECKG